MNRSGKISVSFLILVSALLIVACTNTKVADVMVVDESGKPIAGAAVEPISMSMNYPKVMTDGSGNGMIGEKVQEVKWLKISKKGFESVKVDFKGPKPIKVVLEKEHVQIDFGKPE